MAIVYMTCTSTRAWGCLHVPVHVLVYYVTSIVLHTLYILVFVYMYQLASLIQGADLNFASGGADKVVIIWTSDPPDGRLKYTHSDSVQCISYNPVSQQLVSCTATEVGR